MSRYENNETMTTASKWIIETMTNLDVSSVSPYQETMLQISFTSFVLIVVLIFKK